MPLSTHSRYSRRSRSEYLLPALLALSAHAGIFLVSGGTFSLPRHNRVVTATHSAEEPGLIELLLFSAPADSISGLAAGSEVPAAATDSLTDSEPLRPPAPGASVLPTRIALAHLETLAGAAASSHDPGGSITASNTGGLGRPALQGFGTVGTGAAGTQPTFAPLPIYPERARVENRSGTIELLVSVDRRGVPTEASLLSSSGCPDLDDAARETVRTRWRFPRTAAGEPVRVTVRFNIHKPSARIALGNH